VEKKFQMIQIYVLNVALSRGYIRESKILMIKNAGRFQVIFIYARMVFIVGFMS